MGSGARGAASSVSAIPIEHRSVDELAAAGASRADKVTSDIAQLLEAQKQARLAKRKIQADLKNARRKRTRLTKRARLLSTEELLTVVALRGKADKTGASSASAAHGTDAAHPIDGEPVAPSAQLADAGTDNGSEHDVAEREHSE